MSFSLFAQPGFFFLVFAFGFLEVRVIARVPRSVPRLMRQLREQTGTTFISSSCSCALLFRALVSRLFTVQGVSVAFMPHRGTGVNCITTDTFQYRPIPAELPAQESHNMRSKCVIRLLTSLISPLPLLTHLCPLH